MGGVTTVIRVVRQIRANPDQSDPATPLLRAQQQPQQSSEGGEDDRCINAIALLVIYFLGITSTVLGAVHLNDCPADEILPKLSVIFGGLLLVSRLLNCVYDYRSISQEDYSEDNLPSGLELLNSLFFLAKAGVFYFLCLSALSMHPDTNPEDSGLKNYCDYGLYLACFYGCTIGMMFVVLMIIITCIFVVNDFCRKTC